MWAYTSCLLHALSMDDTWRLTSFPTHITWYCCRKGDPFQGPKLGSCLTLGNELSEETHVLTKREILLGRGAWLEGGRVREPRSTALPRGCSLRFCADRISFRVVFSQSFCLRVLPGGACIAKPMWMPEEGILGGGRTFPKLFRLVVAYWFHVPYQDLLS